MSFRRNKQRMASNNKTKIISIVAKGRKKTKSKHYKNLLEEKRRNKKVQPTDEEDEKKFERMVFEVDKKNLMIFE